MTATIAAPLIRPTIPKEWPIHRFDELLGESVPEPPRLPGLNHLQIEMTNHCDLQCVECPQRLMQRYRQWMTMDVYEAILAKVLMRYSFDTVIPHKDGESLLYPHIMPAIATMARVHRGKFTIYTNGTHFTKEFYDFIRTLPNRFEVFMSFHFVGFASKRFDEDRTKDYDCSSGAEALMAALREPDEKIEFAVSSHVTKWVDVEKAEAWKHEWDDVAKTYTQLRGVHLNTNINPWAGHIDAGTVSFPSCPYGDGGHLFVGVTGDVIPCCMDLNHELVQGNLMTDDMDAIMERRRQFYEDVAVPERRQPRCVTCLSANQNGCGGGCQ